MLGSNATTAAQEIARGLLRLQEAAHKGLYTLPAFCVPSELLNITLNPCNDKELMQTFLSSVMSAVPVV